MPTREFTLRFDVWAHVYLVLSGLVGVAVVPACFDDTLRIMGIASDPNSVATKVSVILAVLLGPALPSAILWLRQPRGRITCDDEAITEWDGDETRVSIRWSNLRANQATFAEKNNPIVLQLSDERNGASITVWSQAPLVAPPTRRRHVMDGLQALIKELERRKIAITSGVDLSWSTDPDRPAGAYRWIGRLVGYPSLLAGMVFAARGFWFGPPILLIGLAGLTVRVYPSWHELRAVLARMAAARKAENEINAARSAYRSPGLSAPPARSAADARLVWAIGLELFVRVGLGVAAAGVTVAARMF